jgi:hypothetical protein
MYIENVHKNNFLKVAMVVQGTQQHSSLSQMENEKLFH